MTTIELYQPGVINTNVDIPTAWNELTGDELKLIAGSLIGVYAHSHESKVHILVGLVNARLRAAKKSAPKNWFQKVKHSDAAIAVTDALAWIFSGISLTAMLLPKLSAGRFKTAYLGPAANFDNITCGEFEDCDIFFLKFKKEKKIEDLVMITAILWRRAAKNARPAYAGYETKKQLKHIAKLSPAILYANYLWYTGCRNTLALLFREFFGGGGSGEPDMLAFTRCIHIGADFNANGTRENIRKTLLKEFALDMEMRIQRNQEKK